MASTWQHVEVFYFEKIKPNLVQKGYFVRFLSNFIEKKTEKCWLILNFSDFMHV